MEKDTDAQTATERDKSDDQIDEAEQDAADPSHEKNPGEKEEDESGNTDVNK
ncbi:MAG: hypothetical protein JO138_03980 [Acidobacteriaceae bacterium]|nr:hypothetical protein [Acidobacteriaceae bacterium]